MKASVRNNVYNIKMYREFQQISNFLSSENETENTVSLARQGRQGRSILWSQDIKG